MADYSFYTDVYFGSLIPEKAFPEMALRAREYLARLQLADLFLDCNPYNAHTTASDALWAGCPVLTRPGDTFAGRVAASLNHHLGLDDMNVATDEQFVERAVALGNDPAALAALRRRVGRQRDESGLFDMEGFAADFRDVVLRLQRESAAGRGSASG